jgi:hypothetical protein
MNVNWVVAYNTDLDPGVDLQKIKNIGSIWGSWRTWRGCQTDNVICHNGTQAKELIDKRLHTACNFYVSSEIYKALNQPERVFSYGGDFSHDVIEQDDLVAMHLAATTSDIVLLLGFDWTARPLPKEPDKRLLRHNYINLVRESIAGNAKTQWVLIDHPGAIMPELAKLPNLTQDSINNVFQMLDN